MKTSSVQLGMEPAGWSPAGPPNVKLTLPDIPLKISIATSKLQMNSTIHRVLSSVSRSDL